MHSHVPAEKMLGAMQFYANFIDPCLNHDLLALHGYEKKF